MSSTPPTSGPRGAGRRLADRNAGARTAFRIAGIVLVLAGLALVVVAGLDFFRAMAGPLSATGPTKFWMFFVGLPLLAVGAWCLQAGFLGVASTYVSEETYGAVRHTSRAVGEGLGVREEADGPFCRSCGRRNDADDRFCGGCGRSLT